MVAVVPKVTSIFDSLGHALPWYTRLLIFVSDTLASAAISAEGKGVLLSGDVLDEELMARLSIPEMARVLHNLLDNAIRHTPAGSEVKLSVGTSGSDVVLSVSDQCGGIPEHDLDRVFDLAYRGDTARSPADSGGASGGAGGLGLAIAKGFIEAHSGNIAVTNQGSGCTFTVNMPRWRPMPVQVPASASASRPSPMG
jgi:signal transduction histidine kinase